MQTLSVITNVVVWATSGQCPDYLDPGNLNLPSKCTIRTRFQTGMTPYLTVIPPRR
ncbi:hypothetical protein H9I48_03955 [Wolbachia pipientis]|uniref:hypothetical protein n=1 Tax=Wolbachia pipientis TaxID=955 RepID=UPI0016518B80|nr:hypothetical protein [Wolbachia pipientis]MBC6686374.1 hypothetical protein [Wolbachia pipientis]